MGQNLIRWVIITRDYYWEYHFTHHNTLNLDISNHSRFSLLADNRASHAN